MLVIAWVQTWPTLTFCGAAGVEHRTNSQRQTKTIALQSDISSRQIWSRYVPGQWNSNWTQRIHDIVNLHFKRLCNENRPIRHFFTYVWYLHVYIKSSRHLQLKNQYIPLSKVHKQLNLNKSRLNKNLKLFDLSKKV